MSQAPPSLQSAGEVSPTLHGIDFWDRADTTRRLRRAAEAAPEVAASVEWIVAVYDHPLCPPEGSPGPQKAVDALVLELQAGARSPADCFERCAKRIEDALR